MRHAGLMLTALAGAAVAAALPPVSAQAATRTGTLDCGSGGTYAVSTTSYGAAVSLADSRQNFVLTYLRADLTGQVLVKHSPGKERLGTLSCTFSLDSKAPGDTATVEGFLTPRRPAG